MATVSTGVDTVMVIHMHYDKVDGPWIESVTRESRHVYENSKGRFIKTTNYGQIFLDEHNRAIIVGYVKRLQNKPIATVEIENCLRDLFTEFNLTGFIK